MKIVAFIPVRGGSKSIPLKNIKSFCGKPLVYWTIKAAVETCEIDHVIVATDSLEIEKTVLQFDFPKVEIYRRNAENAQDSSSTESVILEYLNQASLLPDDLFILIQATSPLLQAADLVKGLTLLKHADSVLSAVRTKRFYWSNDGRSLNYDYRKRPRRQEFEGVFMENGAFYINKVANVQRDKNRLSGRIAICEMPKYTSFEVDELEDWFIMEQLMNRNILPFLPRTPKVKLVLTDVDGVLTDGGMYYTEKGDEIKKFNTRDGMAFRLLHDANIKTGIITTENTVIVKNRAKKVGADFLKQGKFGEGKLEIAQTICNKLGISLEEAAYIGDDINCKFLLEKVGFAACPADANSEIKQIPGIRVLTRKGGKGVFREFAEIILETV